MSRAEGYMFPREKLARFGQKRLPDKWAAIKAKLRSAIFGNNPASIQQRRRCGLLTGIHAPPRVLKPGEEIYVAYRPASDVTFSCYPEIAPLSEKWIYDNVENNAGDLPRLYSIILNVRQTLDDHVPGDMAELGVYRGNSAAVLAYYARMHYKNLVLFDTFEGFDQRDLMGVDRSRNFEFADTSLDQVRDLVGDQGVTFVPGRFPQSIPSDLYASRFCLAHIDCDLYEPAKAGLEFFYPRLSPGGLLILHDYANPYWEGIKRAMDEYCTRIPERPLIFGDRAGTAMIRKSA
jgi:hypothetical protein